MANPSGPPTAFDSLTVDGVFTMGANGLPLTTGNVFFVNETTGSDGNTGSATSPYATLGQALSQCVANHNDVVCFMGTIHLTSTLNWNKAQTHLVGMCAPVKTGKRARISVSGTTGFNKLVEVSQPGCYFSNFGTFYGWPNSSAALIAWSDIGGRSCYTGVEFDGFGDGTVSTGSSNLTGSRAFVFNNNTGESTWRDCVFGVDTVVRNATNYTLELAGNGARMTFENCDFRADLGSSGAAACHLLIGAAGIDRNVEFVKCRFYNAVNSGATTMTQAFNISVSAGGTVLFDDCTSVGATALQTTPTANVVMNMVAATTTGGLAHVVF